MSGFAPSSAGITGLDPSKRVNYRLGLVLGEDEFRQDQYHLRERDQYATRALHGYGTVSGLGVWLEEPSGRLHVRPGVAVDPAGRLICVPVEYCGSLEEWLDKTDRDDVSGGLSGELSVYVVLCWTECETDDVPIPASSCLSAEDSRAASRLMDSFELRLTLEPPPVVGEVADTSLGDGLADLVDELHGLLDVSGSSPPDTVGVSALLREWAVHRRPEVIAEQACLPAPEQACVLLARVDVVVADGMSGIEVVSAVVDDTERPVLVSTRLLQEALFAVGADEEVPAHVHALADLIDVDLSAPRNLNDGLLFDGTRWVAGSVGVEVHADLSGLDADDHQQYLLTSGGRALGGDLSAANHRVTDLLPSSAAGHAVVHGQAAGGDLTGSYPDPVVDGLQGVAVDPVKPQERDHLVLQGGRWVPVLPQLLPFATVAPHAKEKTYVVWFNLDAPENAVEVDPDTVAGALLVQRETETGTFLRKIGPESVNRLSRNVYLVTVSQDTPVARFTFTLEKLGFLGGGTIKDWADKRGYAFVGQGSTRDVVTSYSLRADLVG